MGKSNSNNSCIHSVKDKSVKDATDKISGYMRGDSGMQAVNKLDKVADINKVGCGAKE